MFKYSSLLSFPGIALLLLPIAAFSATAPGRPAPALAVDLGKASSFAVLAKAGVTNVPTSRIIGNLGVSPIAAAAITGFALTLDPSGKFSTSTQVTMGRVYAADYALPTPGRLTTAVSDMEAAFTDAAGRVADFVDVGAGDIGGMNLGPGVYQWSTGVLIPTDVTLTGNADDVWIFQIPQDLVMSSATSIILSGGARARNIFWQVTGLVDLGTTARFKGTILCATGITLKTGASICGRALAQTSVILDANLISVPGL
jgi:hypothetical protein